MAEIEVRNPFDDSVVATVPASTPDDIERAFARAARARDIMRHMPVHERTAILLRAARRLEDDRADFSRTIVLEVGKTIREARLEVSRAVETLRTSAEEARRVVGETVPFDATPAGAAKFGFYVRVPIGVVLAITPFNFPLNLVVHKLAPAIAAGCPVVLKPATKTPLSSLKLARLLHAAGLPPETLTVVIGPGTAIGERLVADLRVRKVSFTGSRDVGYAIARKTGLARLTMELGSNSAVAVFADADLERAAEKVKTGGYALAGQVCISVQRVYVQDAAFAKFLELLIPRVRGITTGNPLEEATDMGPLIDHAAVERVTSWIDEARAMGGRVVLGGTAQGNFVLPTVLVDVPEDARVVSEEAFAPLVIVNRFATVEEAIAKVNASQYGLQAGVFTRDLGTAWKCALGIECGGVHINEAPSFRVDHMPYGGFKDSGLGREGPRYAIEEMTELKLVSFDLR